MKVNNHNRYRKFEYENHFSNPNFELGQVLIKINNNGIDVENGNPIGVVIQLHDDGDCRTDMFGNCGTYDTRLATYNEILEYRKELINDIFEPLKIGDKIKNPEVRPNSVNFEGVVEKITPLFYNSEGTNFFGNCIDVKFRDYTQGFVENYIVKNKL